MVPHQGTDSAVPTGGSRRGIAVGTGRTCTWSVVVEQHARLEAWPVLTGVRDAFLRIADRTGHAVACLSVMLSHLHAAWRAEPETAPREIALCYPNNLAHRLRLGRVGSTGSYVGTFGEYSMQAVSRRLAAPQLTICFTARAELAGGKEGGGERCRGSSPSDAPTSGARGGRGRRGRVGSLSETTSVFEAEPLKEIISEPGAASAAGARFATVGHPACDHTG